MRLPRLLTILILAPRLAGAVAPAPPAEVVPGREVVTDRQVVITGNSDHPPARVRTARRALTTLLFDAPFRQDSLRVEGEGTRLRLEDVGARSLIVEPLVELGEVGAVVRVEFVDGQAPSEATLILVSDPAHVDSHVRVMRRARSADEVAAELAKAQALIAAQAAELAALRGRRAVTGPATLILAGLLDGIGVDFPFIPEQARPEASGMSVVRERQSLTYATPRWMAVALWVRNGPEQAPWRPGRALLVSAKTQQRVEARAVAMNEPQLAPGESGRVVIETGPLPAALGKQFTLELWDVEGGRLLSVPQVKFSALGAGGGK